MSRSATSKDLGDIELALSAEGVPLTELAATRMVMFACFTRDVTIDDPAVLNSLIKRVLSERNKHVFIENPYTIGHLKSAIAKLPDDMPVLIERADSGYAARANILMDYERIKNPSETFGENKNDRRGKNGEHLTAEQIITLTPFQGCVLENEANQKAFVLALSY